MRFIQLLCCLILLNVSGLGYAANYPPDQTDQEPPIDDVFQVTPITDSFDYVVAVSQPPILNPEPVPVQPGNSLLTGSYVDKFGTLYDLQLDLTTGAAKIFNGSSLVAHGVLNSAEIDQIRQAGGHIDAPPTAKCEALCIGIIVAVIGSAIAIAYDEYKDARECRRNQASNFNSMLNEQAACHRSGGVYHVSTFPTAELCGGGNGYCVKN